MSTPTATETWGREESPVGRPVPTPPKLRRRPSLVVASVLLVVIGALASAWAYTSLGHAQDVVAVRADVARGQVITAADLQVVRVGTDPALRTVPGGDLGSLVGKRALVDLSAGQLLVPGSVGSEVIPHDGKSAVGLSLTAAQVPNEPLRVGDKVRVVGVTDPSTTASATVQIVEAEVLTAGEVASDGTTRVTVEVDRAAAPQVAMMAASGKAALVLDSGVR